MHRPQPPTKRKQSFEDVRKEVNSTTSPQLFLDKTADLISELQRIGNKVAAQPNKPSKSNVEVTKSPVAEVTKVPETVDILDDEDDDEGVASAPPTLRCSNYNINCRYTTSRQLDLNKHLWNAHKIKNMKCSECPFVAGVFVDFQNHIKKSHNHEECHNCEFAATERGAMDDHMAKCKFARCNKCDHSAPDQSHLLTHLKTVHDIIR